MSRLVVLSALLAAVLAVGSGSPGRSSPPAADFFLKITGIDGEGDDGAIALAGFAWNTVADAGRYAEYTPAGIAVSDSGVQSPGPKTTREVRPPREAASGMATGRRISLSEEQRANRLHKPFTIVKEWDKASPKLMEACANGTPVGNVEVWSREGEQTTLRYTLTDAIITSYGVSAPEAPAGPVESVSFSFGAVQVGAAAPAAASTTINNSKSNNLRN